MNVKINILINYNYKMEEYNVYKIVLNIII